MEKIVRVLGQSALESRDWTNNNGENVVIKSVQVTITDGVDTLVVEATDKLAEGIASKPLLLDVFYGMQLRCSVRSWTKDGKEYSANSIRIVNYAQI